MSNWMTINKAASEIEELLGVNYLTFKQYTRLTAQFPQEIDPSTDLVVSEGELRILAMIISQPEQQIH